MGPRTDLDGCGKLSPPPGFDPRTVQPVASRYTDRAIQTLPAWTFGKKKKKKNLSPLSGESTIFGTCGP